ncbi:MAG: acetate--CoA ligase family protein [Desulfosalsimonadaceae bacterium]|nr:MAG: carboxylate--amine ligase [Desulfobacteraceae bacterium]
MERISQKDKTHTVYLDEAESKKMLASVNIPFPEEALVSSIKEAREHALHIGFPVVLKGVGIAHKSEANAVVTHITDTGSLNKAFRQIQENLNPKTFLIQEMVRGKRELVVGFERDKLMGPCVMFGLGGIFAEILKDVTFRLAPISISDAKMMLQDIAGKKILGNVRGEPAADLDALARIIKAVGELGTRHKNIKSIDLNPIILCGKNPVAVDALIEIKY